MPTSISRVRLRLFSKAWGNPLSVQAMRRTREANEPRARELPPRVNCPDASVARTTSCAPPQDAVASGNSPVLDRVPHPSHALGCSMQTPLAACLASGEDWGARANQSCGFLENHGQVDPRVRYYLRNRSWTLWLTGERIVLDLEAASDPASQSAHDPAPSTRSGIRRLVTQEFIGARRDVNPEGREVRPSLWHFLRQSRQRGTSVKSYRRVVYRDLWNGIDLALVADGRTVEQEFVVHAGGDPRYIAVRYTGVERLRLDDEGALWADTPCGSFRESPPRIYQEIDGAIVKIPEVFRVSRPDVLRVRHRSATIRTVRWWSIRRLVLPHSWAGTAAMKPSELLSTALERST